MEKKEVLVIRVVTMEDPELLQMHGRLIEQYFPMLHTASVCIPDQPTGICSQETKALAVPKILETARAHRGADAVVVSCCDDPAVEELRRELDVPVVGAGSSVCAVARSIGKRAGVIGITAYVPDVYRQILGDGLLWLGRPEHVTCTLDLMTDAGRDAVIRQALALKEQGAECIALACTGMSTIRITRTLQEVCGLPVVDPVMAEGLFAYYGCLQGALS